jgi:hypothetical protein
MARRRLASVLGPSGFGAEHQGHLSRCDVALLVFDPTSAESFRFLQSLMLLLPEHVPVIFVCTKWDLRAPGFLQGDLWADVQKHLEAFALPGARRSGGGGPAGAAGARARGAGDRADAPVRLPVCYSSAEENPFKARKLYKNILQAARHPRPYLPVGEAKRRQQERQKRIVRSLKLAGAALAVAVAGYVFVSLKRKGRASGRGGRPAGR